MTLSRTNQAFFYPSQDIINNPQEFYDSLSKAGKQLFRYLYNMAYASMPIFASQSYLAKRFNLCRETINRIHAKFKAWRVVHSTRRYNKSNIVYFSGWFLQSCVRINVTITNNKEELVVIKKKIPKKKAIVYVEEIPFIVEYEDTGRVKYPITYELLRLRVWSMYE